MLTHINRILTRHLNVINRNVKNWILVFTSHPASVGESYFQHQKKALYFALTLATMAMAAVLHALIPALCQHSVRNRIEILHHQLQARSASKGH